MMNENQAKKPTLLDLINQHGISAIRISHEAGVQTILVRAVAYNIPVQPASLPQIILNAFNRLAHTSYRLDEVDICNISKNLNRSAANGS